MHSTKLSPNLSKIILASSAIAQLTPHLGRSKTWITFQSNAQEKCPRWIKIKGEWCPLPESDGCFTAQGNIPSSCGGKEKKIFQKFLLLFSQKEFLIKNISRRLIHRPPLQPSSSVYWFCLQSEYFKNFHACFSFRWLTSASKATPLRIRLLQRLAWFQVPSTRNGNCSVATCHNIYVALKIEECRLMIKVNLLLAEVVVVNAALKGSIGHKAQNVWKGPMWQHGRYLRTQVPLSDMQKVFSPRA